MYIPFKPQFYYIKVGFKGVKIICFRDATLLLSGPFDGWASSFVSFPSAAL